MKIGIVGSSPLAAFTAQRLAAAHEVQRAPDGGAAGLARQCQVIVVAGMSPAEAQGLLFEAGGLGDGLSAGKIVVDLTPGEPEQARAIAATLQPLGVGFVDAPLHFERLETLPDTAVVLCGGDIETLDAVQPLLEAICPKVIRFGGIGSGCAARLVVAVVAASNRLVTYECAAMGFRNGLSVEDMGTVLNRCSAANSGTERVLPAIARGGVSADVSIGSVVEDLARASRLAVQAGAPLLVGNLVGSLLQVECNQLGASASLDATFRLFTGAAGLLPPAAAG